MHHCNPRWIDRVSYANPVFNCSYLFCRLFKSVGVNPVAVLGHSSGEMVAAFCLGIATMETLARVVHARARGQQDSMPEGAMAAFGAGEDQAREMMKKLKIEDVDVAAVNSDDNVTLSGPVPSMDILEKVAKKNGVFYVKLPVNRAYHSRYTGDRSHSHSDPLFIWIPLYYSVDDHVALCSLMHHILFAL